MVEKQLLDLVVEKKSLRMKAAPKLMFCKANKAGLKVSSQFPYNWVLRKYLLAVKNKIRLFTFLYTKLNRFEL